jgi:hypothetical protein
MNRSLDKQTGLTFWSMCFVLVFLGIVVLFVIRAFPLYNMKFQVTAAMNSVTSRPDATELSERDVRDYFLRNLQVTNIQRFNNKNVHKFVEVIKPKDQRMPKLMHVHFETRNKLFGDLSLVMNFDEKKPLRGPITGGL